MLLFAIEVETDVLGEPSLDPELEKGFRIRGKKCFFAIALLVPLSCYSLDIADTLTTCRTLMLEEDIGHTPL